MSEDAAVEKEPLEELGLCDAGCGKPATVWFRNTTNATCGEMRCIELLQRDMEEQSE